MAKITIGISRKENLLMESILLISLPISLDFFFAMDTDIYPVFFYLYILYIRNGYL